ncbi:ABC transporter permease [Jannaschia sp. R86511]|uniref:ABC transporter permease n=1 Tax=Jannaschia sp. R86511 TaxID=3093853 RepID=UPI0036D2F7E8
MRPRWRAVGALVARRLALAVPVLLVVSVGLFGLVAVSPFDPVRAYLGDRAVVTSQETRSALAERLGTDAGFGERWVTWVQATASGDLGTSLVFRQPVADVVSDRLGWSLLLSGTGLGVGLVLALVLALVLGTLAAVRPDGLLDRVVSTTAATVESVPAFFLGLLALWLFAVVLGLAPAGGLTDPGRLATAEQVLRHLWLPAGVLAVLSTPWLVLFARQSLRQALAEDYVAGALARGVSPRRVVLTHAAPAAAPGFLALLGARLPELVTGAVLIETVFSWPGVGAASVRAALAVDVSLLAALTVLGTAAVLLGTLLADALAALLDPRVATDG